jgi:SAM-dependent methyltransferase
VWGVDSGAERFRAGAPPAHPTPRAPPARTGSPVRSDRAEAVPPGRVSPSRANELPDDFHALDFAALWKGRDRTTQVESRLARDALERHPLARVVELGTGDGRLSPAIRRIASEYIGVDQRIEFLRRVRSRLGTDDATLLVEANVFHLPLTPDSATAALLARVYNFLSRPVPALAEIRRVLVPGGGLVLTCNVRPSTSTLIDDFRTALGRGRGIPMRSMTFTTADVVPVVPSSFPAFAPTRRRLRRDLEAGGFTLESEFGSEDSRVTRVLPVEMFASLGRSLGSAPIFPLVWESARNGERVPRPSLPTVERSIACPRCQVPFGELELTHDFETLCSGCGFVIRMDGGILRARYVPD